MFLYGHHSDNVAGLGTATPSSEDVDYPIANAFDLNPAKPFRFDAITDQDIVWDFDAPQRIDLVSLVHHNIPVGTQVRFQMNDTDAWTTPAVDEAITIPPYELDGYPVSPWLDLTDKTGYLVGGYQFARLFIEAVPTNEVAIGEIILISTKRSLVIDLDWPIQDAVDRPNIEHVTDYRVSTIYDYGVKQRSLSGTTKSTNAGRAAVKAWWDDCRGRTFPTLIIPFPEDNEAFLVQWSEPARTDSREFINYDVLALSWKETSRGLVL